MSKYAKGDLVFHPYHGAGIITSIQGMGISGTDLLYYVIELATGGRLMTPIGKSDTESLHPLISPEMISTVLSTIPEELSNDFRQRRAKIEEMVTSGDQIKTTEVLRDLAWREHTASLSNVDRQMMDCVKKRLTYILAMQSDQDLNKAARLLDSILAQNTLARSSPA
jgi:CarD family transcriptional regulator